MVFPCFDEELQIFVPAYSRAAIQAFYRCANMNGDKLPFIHSFIHQLPLIRDWVSESTGGKPRHRSPQQHSPFLPGRVQGVPMQVRYDI